MEFVDQIKRPAAHLVINSSNVFADQSHANKLNAAQKQDGQQCADVSVARYHAEKLEMEHGIAYGDYGKEQAERHYHSAQCHSQPKRLIAEAEDRVHGVFEKL